jgi:formylglycine-generating enzyme required for sulfatase activity
MAMEGVMNRLIFLLVCGLILAPRVFAEHYIQSGPTFKSCPVCPEMVVIPTGKFTYVNPWDARSRWRKKSLPKDVNVAAFALAKTEITQRQWLEIMDCMPKQPHQCDDCPVVGISWDDAQYFVYKLSKATGKKYRLPTDIEWEYACRSGSSNTYCGSDLVDYVSWYSDNSGGRSHEVAKKHPNNFGLYDMSGNVREWVNDCFQEKVNWIWQCSEVKAYRNGSWRYSPENVSVGKKDYYSDSLSSDDLGFRPAMDISP